MSPRLWLTFLMIAWVARIRADLPPPQDLLPADTLAVLSLPEVPAARSAWQASNPGRLWADPAMTEFRQRFEGAFRQKWLAGFERESGIDLGELLGMTRGQATLAILPPLPPEPGSDDAGSNWLLLLDTRDGAAGLTQLLDKARARLATNTPPTAKALQSGEHRFTRVTIDLESSSRAASTNAPVLAKSAKPAAPAEDLDDEDLRWEICFGQVGSAFVAGPSWAAITNGLPRLSGTNAAPGLSGKPSFKRLWDSTLKERPAWLYLDVASVYRRLAPRMEGVFGMLSLLGADPSKVVPATGLASIQAIGGSVRSSEAGLTTDLAIEAPASERAGVTQVMQILPLEAGLPEGIPDGVGSFQRWRIDGAAGWKALESSLKRVSPQLGDLARITVESAGQVFDPNFNLQRDLVGNLGNDFITFTLPPTGTNLLQLSRSGRVQMVGSPNPARLTSGWKALEALVHMQAGALEFSERTGPGGRKVMVASVAGKSGPENAFQMIQASNHVVIASDAAAMDAYLVAATNRVAPAIPGLAEAAAGAGGTQRGLFGFSQPRLELRPAWEALRTSDSLAGVMPPGTTSLETVQTIESWADFKRLPPFEAVARYWTVQVVSGGTDAEGFRFRWFSPKAQ